MANFYPCILADIAASALTWGGYVRCQQSHSEGEPEIALIGDSHAEHLFLGIAKRQPDKNIVFYIQDAAPLIDLPGFARIFDHVLAQDSIQTVVLTSYWRKRTKKMEDGGAFAKDRRAIGGVRKGDVSDGRCTQFSV